MLKETSEMNNAQMVFLEQEIHTVRGEMVHTS